jgi:hypothetical protein
MHERRRQSQDKLWELAVAAYPNLKKKDRKPIERMAEKIGEFGKRLLSPLQQVDREQRIQMIGHKLKHFGGASGSWANEHRQWMRWLETEGVSQEQAIAQHEQWSDAAFDDPFFRPAKRR